MIEIIPNWHPIFVHFTFALFTSSTSFYTVSYLISFSKKARGLSNEFEIVARWCLWGGALITITTILAGFYAYNTVQHDEISHKAMNLHRNWALSAAFGILLASAWSLWAYFRQEKISWIFIVALLFVEGLLLSTAWHGGELVYRYGLGVISLPSGEEKGEGTGHHHQEEGESVDKKSPHSEDHHHD